MPRVCEVYAARIVAAVRCRAAAHPGPETIVVDGDAHDRTSRADEQGAPRAGEPDWPLLARWLAGECGAAERAAVERWAATPSRRAELAALRAWWEQSAALPSAAATDAMWLRLSSRMHEADDAHSAGGRAAPQPAPPPGVRDARGRRPRSRPRVLALVPGRSARSPWRRRATLAAVLSVAATAAGLAYAAQRRPAGADPVAPPPMREYVTKPGQRATIDLVDGSRVTLGVASTLRVRPYGASAPGARELFLEGEAVFDVAHNERRPFLVHAGGAVTEDLGTRFGVRAYAGDGVVRVVVAEGQVALRAAAAPPGSGALLAAGDVGRIDSAGRALVEQGADTTAHLGWTGGRLVFRDATVAEVAAQLGRWYDVRVEVAPAVAGRRVTVNMPAGSLTAVLRAVTVPLDTRFAYDREGRTVHVGP